MVAWRVDHSQYTNKELAMSRIDEDRVEPDLEIPPADLAKGLETVRMVEENRLSLFRAMLRKFGHDVEYQFHDSTYELEVRRPQGRPIGRITREMDPVRRNLLPQWTGMGDQYKRKAIFALWRRSLECALELNQIDLGMGQDEEWATNRMRLVCTALDVIAVNFIGKEAMFAGNRELTDHDRTIMSDIRPGLHCGISPLAFRGGIRELLPLYLEYYCMPLPTPYE